MGAFTRAIGMQSLGQLKLPVRRSLVFPFCSSWSNVRLPSPAASIPPSSCARSSRHPRPTSITSSHTTKRWCARTLDPSCCPLPHPNDLLKWPFCPAPALCRCATGFGPDLDQVQGRRVVVGHSLFFVPPRPWLLSLRRCALRRRSNRDPRPRTLRPPPSPCAHRSRPPIATDARWLQSGPSRCLACVRRRARRRRG